MADAASRRRRRRAKEENRHSTWLADLVLADPALSRHAFAAAGWRRPIFRQMRVDFERRRLIADTLAANKLRTLDGWGSAFRRVLDQRRLRPLKRGFYPIVRHLPARPKWGDCIENFACTEALPFHPKCNADRNFRHCRRRRAIRNSGFSRLGKAQLVIHTALAVPIQFQVRLERIRAAMAPTPARGCILDAPIRKPGLDPAAPGHLRHKRG